MATFVLVHGAWGGAHGWRKVRPLLTHRGHEVFTPSLTGIGERSHLTGPHVDLSVHIDDVVNTILYEDLDEIVLLGFSYGGMVVTGALEYIADRVSQLVFLDALVPADGDSANSLIGLSRAEAGLGQPWLIPPIARQLDDPEETEWSNMRRSPQPTRTFSEPVSLSQPLESYGFGLTYIKAVIDADENGRPSPFAEVGARLKAAPQWSYHQIDTNHMIPQNRPVELAEILLGLVHEPGQ